MYSVNFIYRIGSGASSIYRIRCSLNLFKVDNFGLDNCNFNNKIILFGKSHWTSKLDAEIARASRPFICYFIWLWFFSISGFCRKADCDLKLQNFVKIWSKLRSTPENTCFLWKGKYDFMATSNLIGLDLVVLFFTMQRQIWL